MQYDGRQTLPLHIFALLPPKKPRSVWFLPLCPPIIELRTVGDFTDFPGGMLVEGDRMESFEDISVSLEHFSGKVRLFPLPNLVLFPHVMQPLHIFEPRYRNLLEDALAHDRLIVMAMLSPGWENDYEGRPPLHAMGCLGKIVTYCRLADGTYNVLLLGLQRVRLVREMAPAHLFREAQAELCDDIHRPCPLAHHQALHRELHDAFLRVLPTLPEVHEQLDHLLGSDVPLGMLTDVISYMLQIDLSQKQKLLAETDVLRRTELLLEYLPDGAEASCADRPADPFPPAFSVN
jgi:uncharacterized protein